MYREFNSKYNKIKTRQLKLDNQSKSKETYIQRKKRWGGTNSLECLATEGGSVIKASAGVEYFKRKSSPVVEDGLEETSKPRVGWFEVR